MKTCLFLLIFLLLIPSLGNCDEITDGIDKQIKDRVELFFKSLGEGKTEEAFDILLKDSPLKEWAEKDLSTASRRDSLISWTKQSLLTLGVKQIGFEQLLFNCLGTRLVEVFYI